MFTLMSEAQRKQWDTQLYSDDCPEISLDNVIATFRALNASKGATFEQGVIDVFRNLSWSRGRAARIWYHGEDGKEFVQPVEPDPVYTPEQEQRLDALREQYDTYDSVCDESDAIEADILAIQEAAEVSAWTDDMRDKKISFLV